MSAQMVPAAETARPLAAVGEAGSLLAVIARAAADPAVDVEKMERLMQMHRDELARQAAIILIILLIIITFFIFIIFIFDISLRFMISSSSSSSSSYSPISSLI